MLPKVLQLASRATALCLVAILGFGWPALSRADYPDRPIVILVGFAAGGGTDTVARVLARELGNQLRQSVVVENKPGAAGAIAAAQVSRAPADGYTLLLSDPAFVVNTALTDNIGYDLKNGFSPVSTVTMSPLVLVVPPSSKASNVADLPTLANQQPGGLNFASSGVGTTPHLAAEMLRFATNAPLTHVPYKSTALAMTDLAAGQLDFSFATIASAKPFIQKNSVRLIATTGLKRSSLFPDVPTVAERLPNFEVQFWTGLFAPAGTPPDIVNRLNSAVQAAVSNPQVIKSLEQTGGIAAHLSVEKSTQFFDSELQRWTALIQKAKIKPE